MKMNFLLKLERSESLRAVVRLAKNVPILVYKIARPLIVITSAFFVSPLVFTFFVLASSAFLFSYKWLHRRGKLSENAFWQRPIGIISKLWVLHGYLFHGHEIVGFENIPEDGPAILIIFHAPLPIDFFYLGANIYLRKGRLIKVIAEREIFNKFGGGSIVEALKLTAGSRQDCVDTLRRNELILIAPGGAREALYSDNYNILWAGRNGFAKVAKEAKVPIIPIFTKNCQEITLRFGFLKRLFQFVYETTRIGFVLTFGWFPVKLTTYVGKPIEYQETRTVNEIERETEYELTKLIKSNQEIPGSCFYAMIERITNPKLSYLLVIIGFLFESIREKFNIFSKINT